MRQSCWVVFLLLMGFIYSSAQVSKPALVNPFIDTDGHGHTFPEATAPDDIVQLRPDRRLNGWSACSGYHTSDERIPVFSHTHLRGMGIGDTVSLAHCDIKVELTTTHTERILSFGRSIKQRKQVHTGTKAERSAVASALHYRG